MIKALDQLESLVKNEKVVIDITLLKQVLEKIERKKEHEII